MAQRGPSAPRGRRALFENMGAIGGNADGSFTWTTTTINRPQTQTVGQTWATGTMAVAAAFVKIATSWEIEISKEVAGRSGYTWKDSLIAMFYGTNVEYTDINGVFWQGRRIVAQEIQTLLDSISAVPGSILVRTTTAWAVLYPGSAGKVLTMREDTNLPDWLAQASGGGGGFIEADFTASGPAGDAFASLGYFVTFPVPCKIVALQALINPGAVGRTYDLYCAPFDKTTHKITAAPSKAGTFTATATGGNQKAAYALGTPPTIAAGDTWAFWLSQTFGSTTTSPDTYYNISNPIKSFYFDVPVANGLKLASNAPTTADTWTTAAALWAMSFLYQP